MDHKKLTRNLLLVNIIMTLLIFILYKSLGAIGSNYPIITNLIIILFISPFVILIEIGKQNKNPVYKSLAFLYLSLPGFIWSIIGLINDSSFGGPWDLSVILVPPFILMFIGSLIYFSLSLYKKSKK